MRPSAPILSLTGLGLVVSAAPLESVMVSVVRVTPAVPALSTASTLRVSETRWSEFTGSCEEPAVRVPETTVWTW